MRRHFLYLLPALGLTMTTSRNALADQSLNTKIHNQYESPRAMGMGNAFTAVADDYAGMFYNPAALAFRKNGEIQVTAAGAGFVPKILDLTKDIDNAQKSATTDSAKATAISNAIEPYYGKNFGARVKALEMIWVRPNWGIAIIPVDLSVDISVNRQLGPAIDLNLKKDTTLAYSYAREIEKDMAAGITAHFIHRNSVEQSVSALELADNSNVLSKERFNDGVNLDFDLGFMWKPHWFGKTKIEPITEAAPAQSTPVAPAAPALLTPVENKTVEAAPQKETDNSTEQKKASDQKKQTEDKKSDTKETEREPNSATDKKIATTKKDQKTAPETAKGEAKIVEPTVKSEAAVNQTPDKAKPAEIVAQKTTPIEVDNTPLALAAVVRNVLENGFTKTKYINKDAVDAPSKMRRVLDVGSSYEAISWGDLKLRTQLDFKNIFHPYTTLRKSTHFGVELDYSPSGWFKAQVRAGMNQMYMTAGATLLLGIINIDVATYGEEVGTTVTTNENRVIEGKIGLNF